MQPSGLVWLDGVFIPWDNALTSLMTYTLHYGIGVFEGIRIYPTSSGPVIFRLNEHVDRLFYSFEVFNKPALFSKQQIIDAIIETVKKNNLQEGYIRPLIYFGYGTMGLSLKNAPVHIMIAVWQWGKEGHLTGDKVRVKTSPYIRLHPQSTSVDRKIIGNYINSVLALTDAQKMDFDEALLLDYQGYVAEGTAANIFMVKDGKLITPALGSILPGITRDSVINIAQSLSISVIEKNISLAELQTADELFFTGTVVEIRAVHVLDTIRFSYEKSGTITQKIHDAFKNIITGNDSRFSDWLTRV